MKIAYVIISIYMFSFILSSCKQLKTVLPKGSCVNHSMRESLIEQEQPNYEYSSTNLVDFPIIPFQIWGLTYDVDIVLVSEHPRWNMHEFARIITDQGPKWLIKDAYEGTLDQVVTADIEDIHLWLPELPIKRKSFPIQITDRSDDRKLDIEFNYVNHENEQVHAFYKGIRPKTYMKKRNGSTMGHSKHQLLVGLDLPYRDFGRKASIQFDGKDYAMKKLVGILPFQMALKQTQAGISSGQATYSMDGELLRCDREVDGFSVPMLYNYDRSQALLKLQSKSALRTISYTFVDQKDELNLSSAEVCQYGSSEPNVVLSFYPALPDFRKRFDQRYESTFVLDIGGSKGNTYGKVICEWKQDQLEIKLIPVEPWWMLDRKMLTILNFTENQLHLKSSMLSSP